MCPCRAAPPLHLCARPAASTRPGALCSQSAPLQRLLAAELQRAAQAGSSQRYLVAAAPVPPARAAGPDVAVLLRQGAAAADVLEAFCKALLLGWNRRLQAGSGGGPGAWPPRAQLALADADGWMAAGAGVRTRRRSGSASGSGDGFAAFLATLTAAGWAVDRLALQQGPARVAWGTAELRTE